jgi:hypothetical protein
MSWLSLVAASGLWLSSVSGAADPAIDFNFQIRPILAEHCYACHGPDEKARKAKLRLDVAEEALRLRDARTDERAIVPGHPEQSLVYQRITTTNEDDRMPPLSSKLALSADQQEILRRWIEEGAEYKPHWAFIPVRPVAVPEPVQTNRMRNEIDAFVLAGLEKHGLTLSPEASQETLIRRLSFDLRGLPPSLQEIDAFLADRSPNAYEKVVDAFLASPAYGEQQATLWLDLARFADTYGYQSDVERDLSPWRDWVIRAFNANLPFDQFLTWQLAGDLLPDPSRDQVLATAFNRLHRQTNEGGSVEEEFRAEYVADRVSTVGTAFLGLTLGCARCHDHKYDPITHREFYQLSAFFNNIDESGLYSHFTKATPSPTMLLYREGEEERHRKLKKAIQHQEKAIASLHQGARERFANWLAAAGGSLPDPRPTAAFHFDEVSDDSTPDQQSTNRAVLVEGPVQVPGKMGKALQFSGDNSLLCKGAGAFSRVTPFSFSLWLQPTAAQDRAVVFHRSRSWTDSGSRGYELLLETGRPSFSLVHFYPGNAIQVRAEHPIPLQEWSHLAVTYDGSSRAAGIRLYLNGLPLPVQVVRDHLYRDILHREAWGDADVGHIDLALAGRFRDSGFKKGIIDEFQVFDRCLTPAEVRRVAGRDSPNPNEAELFAWYVREVDPATREAAAALHRLREQENALANEVPEIMAMQEMLPRRSTFVLKRGAYDAPDAQVEPGTPSHVFPFAPGLPPNRLGLARWMTDPKHPLPARVVVNRAWRVHFGRGLVATEEDFGTQGKLPTHPDLLDWLAGQFMACGWDLKALHKRIVVSATYRQASQSDPELRAKDPENLWLARGPKHRLRAEEIRDNALSISGLLVRQVGGPSVRPYQPEGLWEESGTPARYVQDKGEGLYRRSLYTFWKRTAPPPSMLIFDAPTREVCLARREATTTPLQALVLLDDPQFIEAGRMLAERLLRECGDDVEGCLQRAFRLATGRAPQAEEQVVLRRLYREQLEAFTRQPGNAEQYLKIGDRRADPALPAVQLAALSAVANAMMNLDEFVTKR